MQVLVAPKIRPLPARASLFTLNRIIGSIALATDFRRGVHAPKDTNKHDLNIVCLLVQLSHSATLRHFEITCAKIDLE